MTTYQVGDIVQVAGGWPAGRVEAVHKVAGRVNGYRIALAGSVLVVKPDEIVGPATLKDPLEENTP